MALFWAILGISSRPFLGAAGQPLQEKIDFEMLQEKIDFEM